MEMTEVELFSKKLVLMEEELNKNKEELKNQQEDFIKFTNEKINSAEFYNEATGKISKMGRMWSLVKQGEKDIEDMKKFISKL